MFQRDGGLRSEGLGDVGGALGFEVMDWVDGEPRKVMMARGIEDGKFVMTILKSTGQRRISKWGRG
jgi:hypothetical protein